MNSNQNTFPRFENIEKIIEYMPGNIYWFDRNGLGLGCNNNVLIMFKFKSVDEFKGLSFEQMGEIAGWSPEATASFKKDTLEVIETGEARINVEEPPIPDGYGNLTFFLTTRVPFYDNHGNVAGMVGVSIDITERKKMEEKLREATLIAETARRAQAEFIANMSHDIKTPLTGIIGIADLLARRLTEEENIYLAQKIMYAGEQLTTFFDHCLEVAKLENNAASSLIKHFNLKALVQEIVDLFQPAAIHKGLKFSVNRDNKLPEYLSGNYATLLRVLINLVGNAIKFTEKGSITIDVKSGDKSIDEKTFVLFSIKDTGMGIPEDKQAYIFERFTRLTKADKGSNVGSGLGLYLVKKYVENMQGEIHLYSKENQGSEFIIAVPLEISLAEHKSDKINIKKDAPARITHPSSPRSKKNKCIISRR